MLQIFIFWSILRVGWSRFSYFGASYASDDPDFRILHHLTRQMLRIFIFCTILRVGCSGFSYFAPSYASDAPDFHILRHNTRVGCFAKCMEPATWLKTRCKSRQE